VTLERQGRVFARLPDISLAATGSVALLGPSGSGKTTALLALAGLRRPAGGVIRVVDRDLWSGPQAERDRFRGRRIGLVFQTFHLIDALTVEDNLALAARCAGLAPDGARISELLERLGLSPLRRRRADRLSQGEAQRVAVARALVNGPVLVLADEPTSALDDENAAMLVALLRESVAGAGAALLIATHDRRVRDRVDQAVAMEREP
jgi:putative ABC transport system ATP-binding protein